MNSSEVKGRIVGDENVARKNEKNEMVAASATRATDLTR